MTPDLLPQPCGIRFSPAHFDPRQTPGASGAEAVLLARAQLRSDTPSNDPVLCALNQIYTECSEEDWDGLGAAAVTPAAYWDAVRFLRSTRSFTPATVAASGAGAIVFEWIAEDSGRFLVSLKGNGKIAFAGHFPGAATARTIDFTGELPSVIFVQLSLLQALE